MYCLENLGRSVYGVDLVVLLTKLYSFKGKDYYYENIFKKYVLESEKDIIYKDATFAAKFLGLNVSDNRNKLILKKNSTPKTNDEIILFNLKQVFEIIQKNGDNLILDPNEFLNLATLIFKKSSKEVRFTLEKKKVKEYLLDDEVNTSYRYKLKEMISLYVNANKEGRAESTLLVTNFFVDLINNDIFNAYNYFLGLVILYCLLYSQGFHMFKYVSFFELLYNHKNEFDSCVKKANYGYDSGYSKVDDLNILIINILMEGYNIIDKKIADLNFDKNLKKGENVKVTIMKMNQTFTKEMIKNAHPLLSDTTINRALKELKDENKIRPTGTGRSAAWIIIAPQETFNFKSQQISIFDVDGKIEEE